VLMICRPSGKRRGLRFALMAVLMVASLKV